MKNRFKTNQIEIKIIASGLLATVLLSSACSKKENTESSNDSFTTGQEVSTITSETSFVYETSMSIPDESINYEFEWSQGENIELDNYVQEKYGLTLAKYISRYGFTNELQSDFTQIVNNKFGTNYDLVPFAEAKYFRSYLSRNDSSYTNIYRDNYEKFADDYLRHDWCVDSVFANKLIMSYIINNNIPFCSKIPVENLKSFYGEDVYVSDYATYIINNKELGIFDSDPNYDYSKDDLLYVLILYNDSISNMCYTEGIPTRTFFYGDPDYQDKCDAAIEMYNGYFVQCYGENAWQIGEVPTREQYIAIFGEEPIDTSLIATPVELDNQVKGSARIDYHDRLDNYTLYNYDESSYEIDENSTGRSR